ncbi:hypothetical protein IEQ34_001266 [Dendrobium chrysotoxum]|uniref:Shikimate dehydrogenase (NADP(+)) n=1 Tax=Dendrobium chrysotoxum TaxID=161865 RepID=A0AAV7HNP7_DENCH|nr:hypothetical protein IEQ34_001266 [Dendrobium chrysotoxum]
MAWTILQPFPYDFDIPDTTTKSILRTDGVRVTLRNILSVVSISTAFTQLNCEGSLLSVTMPHKEAALACSDEVDPIAKYIGAVNTLIKRPSDGKLIGYNTDYTGAISAIETTLQGSSGKVSAGSPLADKVFVVLGAGGAGKALAYGAKEKGARVVIANRTYERAKELANLVGGQAISLADLENFHPEEGMILANTTSIGMHPNIHDTPLSKQALKSYALVFDAIYNPVVTRLLREAEELGVTIVTGMEMFIRQAMGQFELFTGLPAPEKLMRDTLLSVQ